MAQNTKMNKAGGLMHSTTRCRPRGGGSLRRAHALELTTLLHYFHEEIVGNHTLVTMQGAPHAMERGMALCSVSGLHLLWLTCWTSTCPAPGVAHTSEYAANAQSICICSGGHQIIIMTTVTPGNVQQNRELSATPSQRHEYGIARGCFVHRGSAEPVQQTIPAQGS